MRKPRDYDAELKALDERARSLRERKQRQYGELVTATGADVLPLDVLAGALIWAVEAADAPTKEGWRRRGAAFFRPARRTSSDAAAGAASGPESVGGASSLFGGESA
ncbi:conjugal transfer protein TraD [Allosphingosinicella deserti]|uniref:Conjugal transfer protein TraD n=1 Tax=Allosphingosinicella deserti TaxID=2116704 RepID=A0A2P7QZE8_9SPHN|nr:conjugal transfer protein TraD [Sphingomonas deserti]PSJ43337.1 conjugal transfer protein TraD [Sphingomonas deserti]